MTAMTTATQPPADFTALVRELDLEPVCPATVPGEPELPRSDADPARRFVDRAELRCRGRASGAVRP